MELHFFGLPLRLGSQRSLSARGQRLNTFGGIGFSLAFSLLALGGYLIEQQFANPIDAQSLALPVAALLIATAIALLYCLLHSSRKLQHGIAAWRAPAVSLEREDLGIARSAPRSRQARDKTLRDRYVDRACIRIQR
ncbi:MAG: hypothetical protein JWO71_1579 [Candidatus Acidoferrum typicum]|nr:hypothetical protein [Candidatus Acidoferrum typicum]